MKIHSIGLFVKKKVSKARRLIQSLERAREEAAAEAELEQKYTLVEQGGKKLDMMNCLEMKQLEKERKGQRSSKARWLVNTNEQVYRPRELKIDRQLEYMYEELALYENFEITEIGSPKPAL